MSYDEMKAAEETAGRAYFDSVVGDLKLALGESQAKVADLQAAASVASQALTLARQQHDADLALIAALRTEIEGLKAEIVRLTPRPLTLGVALSDQVAATYQAFKASHAGVSGQRIYHRPEDGLPATYGQCKAKHLTGLDRAFVSFKPSIADMKSGAVSTWARGFGLSSPEGTLFCCQHEPDQVSKGISPTDHVAAQNRMLGDMGVTPALRTVCLMEYQFARQGTAYLNGIDPAVLDVVACDFYTGKGNGRSVQQLCEPFFTAVRKMFPTARLAIGELGVSKQSLITDRGQWLKDGLVWLRANKIDTFYYQYNWGVEADWALTDAEWAKALS